MQQGFFTIGSEPAGVYTHAAPHYGVLIADEKQIVLHHHGFLENTPAAAMMIDYWNGLYDYSYLSPLCFKPSAYVPTIGILVCPVNNASLRIPFILTKKLHNITFL